MANQINPMTSHELARLLLTFPDLPVATYANNHSCHIGPTNIGEWTHWGDPYILIGNFGGGFEPMKGLTKLLHKGAYVPWSGDR